jgi:CRISPR-associated protein Cmr6
VRKIKLGDTAIAAEQVLNQTKAALWLLCQFGGIGSKARKGFGSLAAQQIDVAGLDQCQRVARDLRAKWSINASFAADWAESPSISDPDLKDVEIVVGSASAHDVIERIGQTYSAVASRFKHNVDRDNVVAFPNKAAWGLPRKIHGPRDDGPLRRNDGTYIQRPDTWQAPVWLDFPKRPRHVSPANARHASPIHMHVGRNSSGEFVVRLLAMPAKYLTSRDESVKMLKAFEDQFSQTQTASKRHAGPTPTASASTVRPATPAKRSFGTPVTVKFLGPREGKPGFRVLEQGKPEGILNQGTTPANLPDVDTEVHVFIHDDARPPQYRWDRPAQQSQGKPKGGRGGQRPRGRR